MLHNVIFHGRFILQMHSYLCFLCWQVIVKGKAPQNNLMSEMEKETEDTDIRTSISSSEIDADSSQKDGVSGKVDEDNGPDIISYNKEEEEEEEEEERRDLKRIICIPG